jgi:exonuclease III
MEPPFKVLQLKVFQYMAFSFNFLELLEETVNKVLLRGRFLVLCGDWNINLLADNTKQKALISILL